MNILLATSRKLYSSVVQTYTSATVAASVKLCTKSRGTRQLSIEARNVTALWNSWKSEGPSLSLTEHSAVCPIFHVRQATPGRYQHRTSLNPFQYNLLCKRACEMNNHARGLEISNVSLQGTGYHPARLLREWGPASKTWFVVQSTIAMGKPNDCMLVTPNSCTYCMRPSRVVTIWLRQWSQASQTFNGGMFSSFLEMVFPPATLAWVPSYP